LKRIILFLRHNFYKCSVCVLPFIFSTNTVLADKTDSLFKSDVIINLELRSDFSAIQVDRVEDPQYHSGELIYNTPDGKTMKFSVQVMARGGFRRNPTNCNFPPLTLNFKKSEVRNTLFDNQDKLKLVTPCQYDRDVIDEYLIYKMYNNVTDRSFKVRLVKVLYFDTSKGKKLFEKYSFFIEHEDQVAERNNSFEIDKVLTPYDLERETFRNMAFFQYMIGNRDWFITSRRNVVLMQPNDTTQPPYVIPYDFDFAAFVNADYTKPKDVPAEYLATRRVFKGICYTTAEYNEVFAFYKSIRPVFESVIKNMVLIPKSVKGQNISYLDSFYSIIENSTLVKQEFIDKCETKKAYNITN
jgi:hypothetical protein